MCESGKVKNWKIEERGGGGGWGENEE